MKVEETIANDYLRTLSIGRVTYEPNGNITPDFSINDQIGVEVRRLNQHKFDGIKPEALENLSFSIWKIFQDCLRSFDDKFQGESYLVVLNYERPIDYPMKKLKVQMKTALEIFLKMDKEPFNEIQVNEQVSFYIGKTKAKMGRVFVEAGKEDYDVGGFIVSIYIENIRFCIQDKSHKIDKHLSSFKEWWLLLVDDIAFGLGADDIYEIKKHLTGLGNFQKLVLINKGGKLVFEI